ncbi:hypothetical protein BD310DRAFT_924396 [Dichomitus squalens]|uniref:Uncharacterized protein n=1 Tax=Dichomitus squalens TaxID=114155 RepID=A0A4Q9PYC1_9APHY|nr:hypothetical protein BD310DRAFT_924396 [Dichomitus squalens]
MDSFVSGGLDYDALHLWIVVGHTVCSSPAFCASGLYVIKVRRLVRSPEIFARQSVGSRLRMIICHFFGTVLTRLLHRDISVRSS